MGRDAIYPGSTLGIIGINRNGAHLLRQRKRQALMLGCMWIVLSHQ